ncbi:hypothetical protein BMF94_4478 [Rhodotorula taiwanensis]|uniref:Quinate transporter n=1 Tax=Rhodotorula taiwanensis TaxID=741276 RepID=A0A2S5B7A0_9BASI|nr:hypothetical protein BMF94_4478 [Rhodotorula taiwanensis]
MAKGKLSFKAQETEGVPPPKEVNNWRILLLAIAASFGGLCYGYDLGFIGSTLALPGFEEYFGTHKKGAAYRSMLESNIVSIFQAGCCVGAFAAVPIADRFGRKLAIIITAFLFNVGAVLMCAATGVHALNMIYAGRVLTGFSIGATSLLVPVYIAEAAPAHIRGRLVGIYEVAIQLGTAAGFWIGYIFLKAVDNENSGQWRGPMGIQLVPGVALNISMLLLTETPRFMAKKHDEGRAAETLSYLRNLPQEHPYVQDELAGIMNQVENERQLTAGADRFQVVRETFGPNNRIRLLKGVILMIFFQWSGTNAINYYSPKIFATLGFKGTSVKLFATGVYGIVRTVATIISMLFFTDRFGRVSMLLCGGGIMAACMWTVGALIAVYPAGAGAQIVKGQYAAITLIYVYAVAFCFSYAGIPWIYCAEIFPLRIRTFNVAITTFVHWAFNLCIAKSVPYMISDIGYGTYFVFAGMLTLGFVWTYFFLPETKGVPLEDMDRLFGGKSLAQQTEQREHKAEAGSFAHLEKASSEASV